MAQSLAMVLRQQMPHCEIHALAPAHLHPLWRRMPEVDDVHVNPLRAGRLQLAERYRLARRLVAHTFTHAILLPNTFKSALIPYWARIPVRTGFARELRGGLLSDPRRLDRHRYPTTVSRFVALGLPADAATPTHLPVPALRVDAGGRRGVLTRLGLEAGVRPIMALCPGAEYGPAKQWPAEHFAQVARAKLAAGWEVWLFGSRREQVLCERINALAGGSCSNLAGRTRLDELVDLFTRVSVAVTNDSGLMHVASAVGVEVVAVFGSSDPGFTPPLSARARVVSLGLGCSPCFKRECPRGHFNCLRELTPAAVLAALDECSAVSAA